MASLRDRLFNFITSGKFSGFGSGSRDLFSDDMARYILLNGSLALGGLTLVIFGFSVIAQGHLARGLLDISVTVIALCAILLIRANIPFLIAGSAPIGAFGVLCAYFVFVGDLRGFASLWIFFFPMVSIFSLGLQIGLVMSFLLFCALLAGTCIPGIAGYPYSFPVAMRFAGTYLLNLGVTVLYEQTRLAKDRRLARLTRELQAERDEIAAMKDNLKIGLFLLDRRFTIQPAYSKSLETVLGMENLQGALFTDLLASSLKYKERELLSDYLTMVINRSYDPKMLEDINPISTFVFFNDNTETEKHIRASFVSVDRGEPFILGAMEDITAEVELQKRIALEADKRDEEIEALFQVINIEPRVFMDFIEDSEYEFDRINGIMKDRAISAGEAMLQTYQAVHAIKSNALILGLDNFSEKLHELEDKIKKLEEKEDIAFDEALHITVELENIMREKDKFRETLDKIQTFKGGDSRRQDRYVLVETLTKACEKAAEATRKRVKFIVDEFDGGILENGPRRVIKETLTQLVRNAVYHGIETPEERKALGKHPEGQVRLSMKYEDNSRIHLKLSDDGKGLDFEGIRAKAARLNLLSKTALDDRNQLIKLIFSPGFSSVESENVHAGRGIGLNLVKERIRDLRGSIKLQTEPGKGTAFHIYVPMDSSLMAKSAS